MMDRFATIIKWGGQTFCPSDPPLAEMGNGRFGSSGPDHAVRMETDVPAHIAMLTYLKNKRDQGPGYDYYEAKVTNYDREKTYFTSKVITHQKGEPGLAGGTWFFFGGPGKSFPRRRRGG